MHASHHVITLFGPGHILDSRTLTAILQSHTTYCNYTLLSQTLYFTGYRDYGYSYCYEYVQYELSMIIIYLDLRRSQLIITTGHCHYRFTWPILGY